MHILVLSLLSQEEVASADELRSDYTNLLVAHDDIKSRLSCAEEQLAERESQSGLQSELEMVKAQVEQLQIQLCDVVPSRDKALSECRSLRAKQDAQRSTIDALNKQLERSGVTVMCVDIGGIIDTL